MWGHYWQSKVPCYDKSKPKGPPAFKKNKIKSTFIICFNLLNDKSELEIWSHNLWWRFQCGLRRNDGTCWVEGNGPRVRTRNGDWCSRLSTLSGFFFVCLSSHCSFLYSQHLICGLWNTADSFRIYMWLLHSFFLLPEGLIVQCFCFKWVYGTNAGVLIAYLGF